MTKPDVRVDTPNVPSDAMDDYAPQRLSHLALITHDAEATTNFYTNVMRMPLVAAVMHERVPSTGEIMPYLHIFFRMRDGSTIAFFEAPDLPEAPPVPHPAHDIFRHIALEVETSDEVDEWQTWVESQGVEVLGPVDHTIIYSVYFYDPNGNRLEITTPLMPDWNDRPRPAQAAVETWVATKKAAQGAGKGVSQALYNLIVKGEPGNFDID